MPRERKPNKRPVMLNLDADIYREARIVAEMNATKVSDMVESFLASEVEKAKRMQCPDSDTYAATSYKLKEE